LDFLLEATESLSSLRILLVDDQDAVRRGLRSLLASRSDWIICGEASDGVDAVEKTKRLRPNIVLMDVSMPRMDGMEATRIIRREVPQSEVIIVTQNDAKIAMRQAEAVDARGFVSKTNLAQDLLPAIMKISERFPGIAQNAHSVNDSGHPSQELFWDGCKMGALMRSTDWSKTPLGPTDLWSPALRMMVRFMLPNPFPQLLWWGPQFCCLYNDAYIPVLGAKHPWALGRPTAEVWNEIWHVLKPLIDAPFQGGPATWIEDIPLEVNRKGFTEETHFTVAYSPIPDETVTSGIGGVLATVHEISEKVVGKRRDIVLRDLGARSTEAKTTEDACKIAAITLSQHSKDVPFALLYLLDEKKETAYLAAQTGANNADQMSECSLAADGKGFREVWPFSSTKKQERIQLVRNLEGRFRSLPAGPWSDPPNVAAVVPIRSNMAHQLAGFLVAGISSRLEFDETYGNFLDLVSTQISVSIANAREYEEERKRVAALAEIDRAKTRFFSNVSHEFRTPLTLMLGPLQDLLSRSHTHLSPTAKEQLELATRNGARLLRLVNTLLDFSRIEAGRVQAVYQATDLATFTTELASVFRSATDRAGIRLVVDCHATGKPAYVDRDMWEKIVLNLISNAFKFTFEGEIKVKLQQVGDDVELRVHDTGVGIPAKEIPQLFDRFHRVENTRSRTHEGSGIGLALVNELVKLHSGSMQVESVLGQGSTFIVTLPLGRDHLASSQVRDDRSISSTAAGATPFVEEALRWLPESAQTEPPQAGLDFEFMAVPASSVSHSSSAARPRVLVADDNADMRFYLTRLLAERYDVQAVPNGLAALKAIKEKQPDLVLSDVMMPELDGFGLLREVREKAETRTVPFILLSARAGEESRVEGLDTGADDYLVKPFSARELVARVQTHLQMSQVRKEAEATIRKLAETLESEVRERTKELEDRNSEVLRQSETVRALSQNLMHVQDDERRHIARELHDSAGQTLSVLGMQLAEIMRLSRENSQLREQIAEAQKTVEQLTHEIRTTSYLLHPPLLDETGVGAALKWYVEGLAERSGLEIKLDAPENLERFSGDVELVMFRVVQECLTNILRHSGSKSAIIRIAVSESEVSVEVRDFGVGMTPEKVSEVRSNGSGVGLRGIRERVRQLGGRLDIQSDSTGTVVSVILLISHFCPAG
jgi:signal transduction histidine kinase